MVLDSLNVVNRFNRLIESGKNLKDTIKEAASVEGLTEDVGFMVKVCILFTSLVVKN